MKGVSSDLLQTIVSSAPVAMFAGREGEVVGWNRAAEGLFGWKEEGASGRPILDLIVPYDAQEEARGFFATCFEGKEVAFDTVRQRKDGTLVDVTVTLGPVLEREHRVRGCIAVVIDVTEQRRRDRERREYEERYRRVFENSSDAIFVIDAQRDEVVDANPAACSLLRYECEEVRGMPASQVHPDEMPGLKEFFLTVLEKRAASSDEFSCRTRDGEYVPCEISASRLELDGRPYVLALVRDISERKRAQEALDRSFAELESHAIALEKAHSELSQLAYGYHDLSEPLRAVSAYVQLLTRSHKNERDREYETLALDGLARSRALLDGLVRYAQGGRFERAPRPVDTARVVKETIGALRPLIEEREAELTVDGSLPTVRADAVQLGQVFQNLVSNALKFGRPGIPLRIHVWAERENGAWRFSVRDNGTGIEPEYQDRVFEMFWRFGPDTRRRGSGIGLATCRRIVERYGGQIWVESIPGEGSTFSFTLPDESKLASNSGARVRSGEVA